MSVIGEAILIEYSIINIFQMLDSFKKRNLLIKQRDNLKNCENDLTLQDQKKDNLNKLKKDGHKQQTYMEVDIGRVYNLTRNTYTKMYNSLNFSLFISKPEFSQKLIKGMDFKYIQQLNILPYSWNTFLYNQNGNNFTYYIKDDKIKIHLKQCSIHKHALQIRYEPIILKKQYSNYCNQIINLSTLSSFSMIGMLSYNLQAKQFNFQPSFLMTLTTKNSFMKAIMKQFDINIQSQAWNIITSSSLLILIAGVLIYTKKDFFTNIWKKIFGKKNKDKILPNSIKTRGMDRLKCPCGSIMNIAGECDHLSMCKKCFQMDQTCKICKIKITKPIVIYT